MESHCWDNLSENKARGKEIELFLEERGKKMREVQVWLISILGRREKVGDNIPINNWIELPRPKRLKASRLREHNEHARFWHFKIHRNMGRCLLKVFREREKKTPTKAWKSERHLLFREQCWMLKHSGTE